MSTLEHFLAELGSLDIVVRTVDDQLRVNAPKGVLNADLRRRLKEKKQAIIDYLQLADSASDPKPETTPIMPREKGDGALLLSFSQERLWFLDRLESASGAYHIPMALAIEGGVQADKLERGLQTLQTRHEILRTYFREEQTGTPVQVIADRLPLPFPLIDLCGLDQHQQNRQRDSLIERVASAPFDLTRGPLIRCMLLRLGQFQWVLLLNMHHIISDGWSLPILIREWISLYEAYRAGKPNPLRPLPLQFADFSHWERVNLSESRLAGQMNYWKHQLAGCPELHQIPTDRKRPPHFNHRGSTFTFKLKPQLTQRLSRLSRESNTSLFMILETAFALLMARYSGQSDLCIGTPVARRDRRETESLIGFLVNTVVLRHKLIGNPSFQDYLAQTRKTVFEALAHQDLPFEQLVNELRPQRLLSHNPLFQIMFTFENTPAQAWRTADFAISPIATELHAAKFDLTLSIGEHEDTLKASLEYSTDLFDLTTITAMARHYHHLLKAACETPQARFTDLQLFDAAEYQTLVQINREFEQTEPLVWLAFEQQARLNPQAVAVHDGQQAISYGDLNQRGNQLAVHLRKKGLVQGDMVGVLLTRSIDLVIAVFGILKAGGTYLPLDPEYPEERLMFMIRDSEAHYILTNRNSKGNLLTDSLSQICLDDDAAAIAACPNQASPNLPPWQGRGLVYVIYTSGSTGQPKGAGIYHYSFANLLRWFEEAFDFNRLDSVLLISSFSFDLTQEILFLPLKVGGTLYLAPDDPYDPRRIKEMVQDFSITWLNATPSAFYPLIEDSGADWGEAFAPLRWILLGGESANMKRLQPFFEEEAINATVFNAYGPTECTILSHFKILEQPLRYLSEPMPIGRPIPGHNDLVLGAHLHLLPGFASGELCLHGLGLGMGYLKRAAMTADKFRPNPFSGKPGDRLYRSGDLVKRLANGDLIFLGRIDHQVKIRGFRIELNEINAALTRVKDVIEAVTVVREDQPGDLNIVAYLRTQPAYKPANLGVLKTHLPAYMLPTAYLTLERFPLTPNGKIDIHALPKPGESAASAGYVAPRSQNEREMAVIWAEILSVERVGITDNFFSLGGHSLLATRLMARLRVHFQVELPLTALFEEPTIAFLAEQLKAAKPSAIGSLKPRPEQTESPPLSFSQERLWFLDQLEELGGSYHIPGALKLEGNLNPMILHHCLQQTVRRHESLRTRFQDDHGSPVTLIVDEQQTPLPILDLRGQDRSVREANKTAFLNQFASQPFDLKSGPLLRCALLHLEDRSWVFCLNLHHIIADGWSLSVLIHELVHRYRAHLSGSAVSQPPLTIQFGDFAYWERHHFSGAVLQQQLTYWREKLENIADLHALPTDYPRPRRFSHRGGSHAFQLDANLTERITMVCRRYQVSRFMLLEAVFTAMLARYTGQWDWCIGTPIARRDTPELEPLIGFLVNTVVLRHDLSQDLRFSEHLARTQATVQEALTHQDLPFERLVDELQPNRSLSHSPLFQIMFTFDSTPTETFEVEDFTMSPLAVMGETAKFDLSLSMGEQQDVLGGSLAYCLDLLEHRTIVSMVRHYIHLLSSVCATPEARISRLNLFDEYEKSRLVRVNSNPPDVNPLVWDAFERHAQRAPHGIAVNEGSRRLSYGDLDQRANQFAAYLRRKGLAPGDTVGVLIKRSIDLAIGVYGILKAGGTYVPLDPNYPTERLNFMMRDSNLRYVVTHRATRPDLSFADSPSEICLDTWAAAGNDFSGASPPMLPKDHGRHLLYVIFTSGSTGRPKGVGVYHRSFANLMHWFLEAFKLDNNDAPLLISSFNFDLTQKMFFIPLMAGGTLYLAPDDHYDPTRIKQIVRDAGITWLNCTPSAFYPLVEDSGPGWQSALAGLRWVLLGGEATNMKRLQPFFQAETTKAQLVNTFGPTECTVISHCKILQQPLRYIGQDIPIGQAIAGQNDLILNPQLELLPQWLPGELCIHGPGLAMGYLNHPAQTADKFRPNPYGTSSGDRLYRTGDLVKRRTDGDLVFLGRIDHQVKIRGFRIELNEINTALSQIQGVLEAWTMVREDRPGDIRIVAYLSTQADYQPANLQRLKEQLPHYMLPSAYVSLDRFPVSPNGKLDIQALPKPKTDRVSQGYVAPRSSVEREIAAIWSEFLAVEKVGITDNFFSLGGHSLLATRLVSRLRAQFQTDLPLTILFEEPTIAALAKKLQQAERRPRPPIQPRSPSNEPLPLSFSQERLWFLAQLESSGNSYYIPCALQIKGLLDPARLDRCLQQTVQRHESLRTRFHNQDGSPVAVVLDEVRLSLPVIDLRSQDHEQRQQDMNSFLQNQAREPFDLEKGPLLRAALLHLEDRHWAFCLTMHHIVCDGWSLSVLIHELVQRYEADANQTRLPFAPMPIQFGDFACWERQQLSGPLLEQQLDYWRGQLLGIADLHALPCDHPRPPRFSYRGGTCHFRLDGDLTRRLTELCRQYQVSQFMLLEAAFTCMLARHSGHYDWSIGTPVARRDEAELEPLIGFLVNTVVLRHHLGGNPSFSEHLQRTRDTVREALAHQNVPFERLVDELQPSRNLSHSPLFQIMFTHNHTPSQHFEIADFTMSPLTIPGETAKFDLTLSMNEHHGELAGSLEYSTDLFEHRTIASMVGHYLNLLAAVAANPEVRLANLHLFDSDEYQDLVWGPKRLEPIEPLVWAAFEKQANLHPQALALHDGHQSLSYGELDVRANQLAAYLRDHGLRPGDRVGVLLKRSIDLIVAIYATLKAGGTYLPMDPNYPRERLALMLTGSDARFLLTNRDARSVLTVEGLPPQFCFDDDAAAIQRYSGHKTPPLSRQHGDNLMYVIYTSGSTGQPKGAAVYHRGFANLLQWFIEDFELGKTDAVLLTSSVSFDLTQKNLYAPLMVGGTLFLAQNDPYDPFQIKEMVGECGITWLNCTPSAFYPLIEDSGPGWQKAFSSLRWVFLGGEPISMKRLQPFIESEPCKALFVNTYGPTECTDISHFKVIEQPMKYVNEAIPIGQTIPGQHTLVLDNQLVLLPAGASGELCLHGSGMGIGYLKDAALTATKFLPNRYSGLPGDRLYQTGDLVKRLHDGDVVFLGRMDHQVKIRGFRIELSEIDAALTLVPSVSEAVTVVREEDQTGPRIVAYLCVEEELENDPLSFLREHLPEYMVPSIYLVMDGFPLTPSGKIDRKRLPKPPATQSGSEYVAPRTEAEAAVAAVWSEVLNVAQVGIHDHFFRLGGHSLLATRVVSQLRTRFNLELPLRWIFEQPTIAGLAGRLTRATSDDKQPILPRNKAEGYPPLSFSQERLWFLYQFEGPSMTYNIPAALSMHGGLDVQLLAASLRHLIQRHESLRTTFAETARGPVQIIAESMDLPLTHLDLSGLEEAERERRIEVEIRGNAHHLFGLEQGPLIRFRLLRTGGQQHIFLLNMHHIISDGWSLPLLIGEWSAVYQAGADPNVLEPLPIQYADYGLWQRRQAAGGLLSRQVAYWHEQLAAIEPLNLACDAPRPAVRSFTAGSAKRRMDPEVSRRLYALSACEHATPFMVLITGFAALLGRLASQGDLCIGTPVAGRNRSETENLVGFFLNTLVLRFKLGDPDSAGSGFRKLLQHTRETALAAYENQDLPFEKLLAELKPKRDLSRTPLFQVFFNMLNLPFEEKSLTNLQIESLESPGIGTKFDMTLYVNEQEQSFSYDLTFNADLFSQSRMETLLDQYIQLLAAVAENPDIGIQAVDLVTPADKAVLPDPTLPLPRDWRGPAQQWCSRQARQNPQRPALITADRVIAYDQFERSYRGLAARLNENGIGRGDVVAIFGARDATLVSAVYATLHAGAVYTILDPKYPASRLKAITRQSGARAWLHVAGAGAVPEELEGLIAQMVQLRISAASFEHLEDGSNPINPDLGPHDSAYLGFTSGTTGEPKGIVGCHGPLTHFLPWLQQTFHITPEDRFSMLSGLAHDPLQRDMFTPLSLGASLYIPEIDDIGPRRLAAWMNHHDITITHLTPAMTQILVQTDLQLPHLRLAFITGDILTLSIVRDLRRIAPSVEVVNFYGSTETSRAVAYAPVARNPVDSLQHEVLPLGKGIPGVQLLILNPSGRLCGRGEIGEIHLRSPHLTLGYLDHPELSAQSYLNNPFSDIAGDRIYRTGDLGYYDAIGMAVFAGRRDHQMKIRGYRVEAQEIEAVLMNHPACSEAVVLLQKDDDVAQLTAFTVTQPELFAGEPARIALSRQLKQHVKSLLPAYMVPSQIIPLAKMPLTPNGKIDRSALLAMVEQQRSQPLPSHTAPTTESEILLADIWSELLACGPVDRNSDFFELGGHSLLATRVLARVFQVFGLDLPLRTLFEFPTIAGLAAHLENTAGKTASTPPLVPTPPETPAVLSFAQQRLWFLEQFEDAHIAYNMPFALAIDAHLDVAALNRALVALITRHEVLHTRILSVDGQPLLNVADVNSFNLPIIDCSACPKASVQNLLKTEATRPFNLERDIPLRCTLLRESEGHHVLLLTMHHICSDGWSLGLLVNELDKFYEHACRIAYVPIPADPLPIQYRDYAHWQRLYLSGELLKGELDYWRRQLDGLPAKISFPCDFERPETQTFEGGLESFIIERALADQLDRLCTAQGVTLFMLLEATFALLLYKYSGDRDIAVGTPIAGRTRTETEVLIGLFVNTLVLRNRFEGDPYVTNFLAQVRKTTLDAFSHQHLPFEKVIEAVNPVRDLSYPPLFQMMFVFHNQPQGKLNTSYLKVRRISTGQVTTKFDLTLSMNPHPEGLAGFFEYNTKLFKPATIQRLHEHFVNLLRAITNPAKGTSQRLSRLAMLSDQERETLLYAWNPPALLQQSSSLIHHSFEQQVARSPRARALVSHSADEGSATCWTFLELDQRANYLAQTLIEKGTRPGDLVGICMERDGNMVAAILAVLKTGAAYVPIDPDYPREWQDYMIEDSGLKTLIVCPNMAHELEQSKLHLLVPRGTTSQQRPVPRLSSSDDPSHVIYTSGSTGRPKGVVIRHANVAALLDWAAGVYHDDHLAGVLAATSICFDLSIFELFVPLTRGGTVHLIAHGPALAQLPNRDEITLINTVPSTMAALISQGAIPASVRVVNLAGETLHASLVRQIYDLPGVEAVYNLYGPTEDTTYSTWQRLNRGDEKKPLIGLPLNQSQAYVLDGQLGPIPIGVVGELYLGGAGLSLGYLEQPALTAGRYLPDPFSRLPGRRIYYTGDLVRRGEDGRLEFLGRSDHQVKLRGLRIELGEIEVNLNRHSAVHDCAVLVDGNQLAAYVQRVQQQTEEPNLRALLAARLPNYMVPDLWFFLEKLPHTPNGKIDRRALSQRVTKDRTKALAVRVFSPPQTPTETVLSEIWSEVLALKRVSVSDNFFELGGDSILSLQIVARARAAGILISAKQIFTHQTIRALAVNAGKTTAPEHAPTASIDPFALAPLNPAQLDQILGNNQGIEDIYPLSPLQDGILFHALNSEAGGPYLQQYSCVLEGTPRPEMLRRAWRQLVKANPALRTQFLWRETDTPLQLVHHEAEPAWFDYDWRHLDAAAQRAALDNFLEADRFRGLALEQAPLMRISLVRLNENRWHIIWTFHHLILDGWSIIALLGDLLQYYRAMIENRPAKVLPRAPFRNYIAWLMKQDQTADETYWKDALTGFRYPTPLPAARQKQKGPHPQVALKRQTPFSPAESERLRAFARKHRLTLNTLIQGAWALALSRYAGQNDVLFGAVMAGRPAELPGVERMLGLFINTLPVRLQTTAEALVPWLLDVQARFLSHQSHGYSPLSRITAWSEIQRPLPLFQSLVIVQNFPFHSSDQRDRLGFSMTATELNAYNHYPLSVGALPGETIRLAISFDSSYIEPPVAERLLRHFRNLLLDMPEKAHQPLQRLAMMDEAERRSLIKPWDEVECRESAIELIEARARQQGDAIALQQQQVFLTYAELEQQANRLTQHLHRSVSANATVAICLERSPAFMISALAIWKAGCAYIPLDPREPGDRLEQIVVSGDPALILTNREALAWKEWGGRPTLEIKPGARLLEKRGLSLSTTSSLSTAYMVFTSGSTGKAKGVVISQASLASLIRARIGLYQLNTQDRLFIAVSPVFDGFIGEAFTGLAAGTSIVLRTPGALPSTRDFLELWRNHHITIAGFTPALWSQIADDLKLTQQPFPCSLRLLVSGGDRLPKQFLSILAEQDDTGPTMINVYGPTETTVIDTAYRVDPQRDASEEIPIGRPLDRVRIYLLDPWLQPVPVGIAGEITSGGDQLARGYQNDPVSTAERFIPNPWSKTPGARLYRSGDLGCYRQDGNIQFLGRLDHQVKIRGYRVELDEIRTTLERHAEIDEVLIVLDEEQGKGKRLLAYFRPLAEQIVPNAGQLRSFLHGKLPEFMLPTAYIAVNAFPFTKVGKLDRGALPTPQAQHFPSRTGHVAAANNPELRLGLVWEEVLGVHPIGMEDHFFDLGGHSILALRLVARIEQTFGRPLELAALFANPTVRQMAVMLTSEEQPSRFSCLVPIQASSTSQHPPIFCVHPVGGNVLIYGQLARELGRDQPFYGLQSPGLNEDLSFSEIAEIAAHYLRAVLEKQAHGPYQLAGWSLGGVIAYEMGQQLVQRGETVQLTLIDTYLPAKREWELDDRELLATRLLRESHIQPAPSQETLAAMSEREQLQLALADQAHEPAIYERAWRLWQVYKQNYQAMRRYQPLPWSGGPVLLFRATEEPELKEVPLWSWQELIGDKLTRIPIACDHEAIIRPPMVTQIARQIPKLKPRKSQQIKPLP